MTGSPSVEFQLPQEDEGKVPSSDIKKLSSDDGHWTGYLVNGRLRLWQWDGTSWKEQLSRDNISRWSWTQSGENIAVRVLYKTAGKEEFLGFNGDVWQSSGEHEKVVNFYWMKSHGNIVVWVTLQNSVYKFLAYNGKEWIPTEDKENCDKEIP